MELSLKTSQNLTLSPQMELSVRILQMDSIRLTEYLREVMLENPVAELELPPERENRDELAIKKMEWLENQTVREKENVGYYDEDDGMTVEKIAAAEGGEALADYLLRQASYSDIAQTLLPAVRYVIGCLDENGYLAMSKQELLASSDFSAEQTAQAVSVVQGFDPAGVGAADLRECLLLQLAPEDTLARRLVDCHLEEIARNRIANLVKQLHTSETEIESAIRRIRQLNPKPGALYSRTEAPRYITPDVVVTSFENQYNVMLCEFSYPEIRINQSYLRMAQESGDREVSDYISGKIRQIEWIHKCIESRNNTLLRVAKAIVRRQERFFRYGPQYLNVLRMKDVADQLEIHESTVSRAVRDKYLQCSHGVYPLRHFFVRGMENCASPEAPGAPDAKRRITQLIEAENSARPLSDQKLAELLSAEGFTISRRTVAKYREELGIPNSSARK